MQNVWLDYDITIRTYAFSKFFKYEICKEIGFSEF